MTDEPRPAADASPAASAGPAPAAGSAAADDAVPAAPVAGCAAADDAVPAAGAVAAGGDAIAGRAFGVGGTVLLTGATGTLGRVLGPALRERGLDVRGLSRGAPGHVHADLLTGDGLAAALDGVGLVVHAATDGRHDVRAAETLIAAMRPEQGLVYVSIVGVDRIPFPYYRQKLAVERLVQARGGAVFRATQFHDLMFTLARLAARSPVMPYPALSFQPCDVADVAPALASFAANYRPGAQEDFAGPEVLTGRDLFATYLRAAGKRRLLLPVRVPGRTFNVWRTGANLAPDRALGTVTWADYLHRRLTA